MNPTDHAPTTLDILRDLGSATIYEAQGGKGALDHGLKPIHRKMRVAGPAVTVDVRPGDNLMLHYALLHTRPGDVLVVDAKGFLEAGPWGDVLTEQAVKQGLGGLVIHGAVRDAAAIIEMGFPVFARGLSIKGTTKTQTGSLNVPICIGEVQIRPGDIVVGDVDGLVVVAADEVEQVIASSRAREEKEEGFRQQIRSGANTVDLLGLGDSLRRLNLS